MMLPIVWSVSTRNDLANIAEFIAEWNSSIPELTTKFDPMISVFNSAEEETDYTAWLRAKLQASVQDPRPSIPHEQVMAEIRQRLAQLK